MNTRQLSILSISGIVFFILVVLLFKTFSQRYVYTKTGKIIVGGLQQEPELASFSGAKINNYTQSENKLTAEQLDGIQNVSAAYLRQAYKETYGQLVVQVDSIKNSQLSDDTSVTYRTNVRLDYGSNQYVIAQIDNINGFNNVYSVTEDSGKPVNYSN